MAEPLPAIAATVDFWRGVKYDHDLRMRLVAEMKLPGRACLEFGAKRRSRCWMVPGTAVFDPVDLRG